MYWSHAQPPFGDSVLGNALLQPIEKLTSSFWRRLQHRHYRIRFGDTVEALDRTGYIGFEHSTVIVGNAVEMLL